MVNLSILKRQGLAGRVSEPVLHTEHKDAFVNLGPGGQATPAQWQLAGGSMFTWVGQNASLPSNLGISVTYLATGPIIEGSAPDCDFAVPTA